MSARFIVLSSVMFCPPLLAGDPLSLPDMPGWSGYLGAGAAYYDVRSNFIAGNRLIEFDNEQSAGLDRAPASDSATGAEVLVDLRFTFEGLRTQLFLGNLEEDMVRLDFTHQLGVRHSFGEWGIGALGYVFSGWSTEVWQDPFYTDGERVRTDRDSQGLRLAWSGIAGSTVGANYTYRRIDVDQDLAGESLLISGDLTLEQQRQLERDGHHHRIELNALWQLDDNQQLLPALIYIERSTDGRANQGQTKGMQLTYAYQGANYSAVVTGYYGSRDYDNDNPIFDAEPDADEHSIAANLFWHQPMGLNQWDIRLGLLYFDSSATVEFYDSELFGASLTLLYRFR